MRLPEESTNTCTNLDNEGVAILPSVLQPQTISQILLDPHTKSHVNNYRYL